MSLAVSPERNRIGFCGHSGHTVKCFQCSISLVFLISPAHWFHEHILEMCVSRLVFDLCTAEEEGIVSYVRFDLGSETHHPLPHVQLSVCNKIEALFVDLYEFSGKRKMELGLKLEEFL